MSTILLFRRIEMPQPVNSKGIVVETNGDVAPIDASSKELERGQADRGGLLLGVPRSPLLQRDHLVKMEVAQTAVLLDHGNQLAAGFQATYGRDMYAEAPGNVSASEPLIRIHRRQQARGPAAGSSHPWGCRPWGLHDRSFRR